MESTDVTISKIHAATRVFEATEASGSEKNDELYKAARQFLLVQFKDSAHVATPAS